MPPPIDPNALLAELAWLRRLAASLAREVDRADDLAQDVCVVALKEPTASTNTLRAWLTAVTRNLALVERRSAARRQQREHWAARAESVDGPDVIAERAALQRELFEAVMALEESQRTAILLRYFEGLSPRAIAAHWNVPLATVKSRLARGLAELRARLDGDPRGRDRWLSGLVPLVPLAPRQSTPVISTTILMMKTKLLLVCVCAIVLAVWVWRAAAPEPIPSVTSPTAAAQVASADEGIPPTNLASREPAHAESNPSAAKPASTLAASEPVRLLTGHVVDTHGQAVAGARVEARRNAVKALRLLDRDYRTTWQVTARTTTDESGAFAIEAPVGRSLELHVERAGFAASDSGPHWSGEDVSLVLTRGARLSGFVTRIADGSPCSRAAVVVRPADPGDHASFEIATTTDERGAYGFESLPCTHVLVTARPLDALPVTSPEVALADGRPETCDLRAESGNSVVGRVTDKATGLALAGATVEVEWWTPVKRVTTDERGEYEVRGVDTRAGQAIYLRASAEGHAPLERRIKGDGSARMRIEFALPSGFTARGRVLARGVPLSGAYVAAVGSGKTDVLAGKDHVALLTTADGRFALEHLRPDAVHVLFVCHDGYGTRAIDFPPSEGADPVVECGDVELVPGALVEGVVVDDAGIPAAGATVVCRGSSADRGALGGRPYTPLDSRVALREARTDAAGRFAFADLASGTYKLGASWRADPPQAFQELTLAAGQRVSSAAIVLARGLALVGRVVDEAGQPLAEALVRVYRSQTDKQGVAAEWTLANGSFRVAGLEPGTYTLRIQADPIRKRVDLPDGTWSAVATGGAEQVFALERSREITGRLLEPGGRPAVDVLVFATEGGSPENGVADATATTDAEGRFRLAVRGSRSYTLHATRVVTRADGTEDIATARRTDVSAAGRPIDLLLEQRN